MKVVISVEYFENGVYNVEILSILGRNQCLTDGVGNQRQIIVESVCQHVFNVVSQRRQLPCN